MDIHIETTGCRLNQIESESIAKFFLDKSFSVSLDSCNAKSIPDETTSIVIVNTCAVTVKAEQKDRRIIRLMLEKFPNATVIVTGCYAQLSCDYINSMNERICCLKGQLKSRLEKVCIEFNNIIRSGEKFNAFDFSAFLRNGIFLKPQEKKNFSENPFKLSTDSFLIHSRSSIKIQDGCNNYCSYCTIHIARGFSSSLDVQTVIDRVKQLEKVGMAEVVFTTVNIAQYRGKYGNEYLNFSKLLKLCLENTENIKFRISSLYPEIVDDEFCDVIKNARICPHFHISVQSGSDVVLKNMARNYKADDVLEACRKIREVKENPFIACDIITGFPGESDDDFNDTLSLCRKCNFSWIHVFPFSPRPGTKAFEMKNKVPEEISNKRAKLIGSFAAENKKNYIESCIGKVFDAVLEGVKNPEKRKLCEKNKIVHAVTENFLHCEVSVPHAEQNTQGKAVKLKIVSLKTDTSKGGEIDCLAEIVN